MGFYPFSAKTMFSSRQIDKVSGAYRIGAVFIFYALTGIKIKIRVVICQTRGVTSGFVSKMIFKLGEGGFEFVDVLWGGGSYQMGREFKLTTTNPINNCLSSYLRHLSFFLNVPKAPQAPFFSLLSLSQ